MQPYDTIDAVNISTLKTLWSGSPRHYQHRLRNPLASTPALLLGIATHMAVLEPLRFAEGYIVRPLHIDGRTKAGKAWLAENEGQPILTVEQHALCTAMASAVEAHPVAASYLSGGKVEHAITWTDEETGIACKGRLDLLRDDGVLVGLKTAQSVTPRRFCTQAARLGYHLQWAFYHDGLVANGITPPEVVEVVVESALPHDVVPYLVPPEVIDEGRIAYRDALQTLKECRVRNMWPGQVSGVQVFQLPAWALSDDDDDLSDLDWGEGRKTG
jgi:exodeoxyribonuclease VIII